MEECHFLKLQAKALNFSKYKTPLWVIFHVFKIVQMVPYKWYQIAQNIT